MPRARHEQSVDPRQTYVEPLLQIRGMGQVVQESPVSTRRLDDIEENSVMDFLKIDVQGSELSIFRHGHSRLMQAVAVQTEVSFLALYHDQPVLGEIDNELRGLALLWQIYSCRCSLEIPLLTAGDPQGLPDRVLAPQRRLDSIGPVLRG